MTCSKIFPYLKWGFLSAIVLFVVADSLTEMFTETQCFQNGRLVNNVISGSANCSCRAGFRLNYLDQELWIWTASYIGSMTLNKMNGKGVYRGYSGITFDGYFLEDMREGPGTFYSPDSTTSWYGSWERNVLTCQDSRLVVNRTDILNKFPFKLAPTVHEVSYEGGIQDGIIHGMGSISAYSYDPKSKQKTEIFKLNGKFNEGALNAKDSIFVQFSGDLKRKFNDLTVEIRNFESQWKYGAQYATGDILIHSKKNEGSLENRHYFYENGILYNKSASGDQQLDQDNLDNIDPELHEVYAVLQVVRAFEWHFIYHRMILDPITPFLDSSELHSDLSEGETTTMEKSEL